MAAGPDESRRVHRRRERGIFLLPRPLDLFPGGGNRGGKPPVRLDQKTHAPTGRPHRRTLPEAQRRLGLPGLGSDRGRPDGGPIRPLPRSHAGTPALAGPGFRRLRQRPSRERLQERRSEHPLHRRGRLRVPGNGKSGGGAVGGELPAKDLRGPGRTSGPLLLRLVPRPPSDQPGVPPGSSLLVRGRESRRTAPALDRGRDRRRVPLPPVSGRPRSELPGVGAPVPGLLHGRHRRPVPLRSGLQERLGKFVALPHHGRSPL